VTPTRTFAALLLLAAIGCAALSLRSTETTPTGVQIGDLTTPMWSPRRVPQPIVAAVGALRLQAALDAETGGVGGCFVVQNSGGGAALASRTPDAPVLPASTQKILTGAAALSILGPDTTLDTRAVAPAAPADGQVERLFLVGGGDPLLSTPEFQALLEEKPESRGGHYTQMTALADAIVNAGVRRIPGGIVGDDSRYENVRYLPSWPSTYRVEGQSGPIGALTVNHGFRALRPQPDPVDDPAAFAAEQLGELLRTRGVTVGGPPRSGKAPDGAVEVAKIASPPIKDVVFHVLRVSDNLAAEMLVREMGLKVSQQGTTSAGTQAMTSKLGELGVPMTNVTIVDGSGLSRDNRSTCQAEAATLALGARPGMDSLWNGLPVAGESGTLVDELRGTPLQGKLRAKTGFLNGVTGLSGLVDLGAPLQFAFVGNGTLDEAGAIALRGRFAGVLGTFPDAPPADQLVPAPATEASP
jgi:D-alanyl-D-alanine carboxypeptidase/D-alanyl-D-alanine-endopeptidase (penicillin-binding protein 4)